MRRLILIALPLLLAMPALAADSLRDQVIAELQRGGFTEVRISRTLLGRLRFVASRAGAEREIVINPATGQILRDQVRFWAEDDDDYAASSSSSGSSGGSGSNSGPGSGDDDDDDDDDRSGSNSGSSKDDDDDDDSGRGRGRGRGGDDDRDDDDDDDDDDD